MIKPILRVIPALMLTLALGSPAVHEAGPGQNALAAPDKIVTGEWLAANLTNPNIRIVDLRDDIRSYWESHIPGAVFIDSPALRWPERGVPGKLMTPRGLALLLGEMGIGPDTQVIVYTEINNYRGTYLIWALDYIGHKSSAILMGGFDEWKKNGGPLNQDYPTITPTEYRLPAKLHEEVRATLQEVKGRNPDSTVLLDVRTYDLYSGEKGPWKRKGHIKGAIHHLWAADLKPDGSWIAPEKLTKIYAELGVTPDKTVYVSCGQGLMASHVYFTLRHILGFPKVKNYDGSFNEWSNHDELPVEQTGKK
jgi:thiosulfate/3-mercaptopyruvate sulfurtransferase